ncbi:MAG: TonB-dependent receptor [Aquabacterium sp.]
MRFRYNAQARAIRALAIGTLSTVAIAALAQAPAQRVEITGSAIKRVNAEGPAPVEVITRRDIERTGATSVNELIRSIPSIDVFDQGELASNSPSGSGTTNLALRGLASSNLLVLLNGRRLPVNALYDSSGAGAAVDVNMIPVSAIDRVEILKDGGSAIYGADAVAGVINIITRTDYAGLEARIGFGQSSRSDGAEKPLGLTWGMGNLAKDRFNVLFGMDLFKRDPIMRKDRELSSSVDFRRFGGPDRRSSFAPLGNVADPNTGAFVGLTYKDCPPADFNAVCRYDFNRTVLTAYNGADRVSALLVGNFQVTPDIRAFAEFTWAQAKDHFDAHPVPDFFNVPILNDAQRAYEDPTVPGTVLIAGRFLQGGPRMTDRKSTLLNVAVGAEGSLGTLDWKLNAGRGISKVSNQDANYFNADLWGPATTSGQLDPTVSTNDAALVDRLKVRPLRTGEASVDYVNAQLGGELMKLPAGEVRYAVGASYTRESLQDTPDPLTQAGKVIGSIRQAAVDASRNSKGVFAELSIPVLKSLEAQVAVRHDAYSNASRTSPKVALKFTPSNQMALRASYSESFRAPVLKQLYGAQEQGAITITDDAQCVALGIPTPCQLNAFQVNGSNPNLKPETGETMNLGLIIEPMPGLSLAVDTWRIHKTDDISAPTIASAIAQGLWSRQGARVFVFTNLNNIAERETRGTDVDARLRIPNTVLGNVSIRNLFTYYESQRTKSSPGAAWAEFIATYAVPRWRNGLSVSVERGPWVVTTNLKSVAGFWDTDQAWPAPVGKRRVGSFEELDLQVGYSGLKNASITFGVKNLLDRMPPFSVTNASSNAYTQMGFAELYGNRGRFLYGNVRYTFW